MRKPEEILKGCTDQEMIEVLNYINNRKKTLRKEREKELFNEISSGMRVNVVRKGKVLWTGTTIKQLRKNILVERDDTRVRYRVPPALIQIVDDGWRN